MNRFLTRLIKEKKVQLVEESAEMCESYQQKTDDCLLSAKILLENGLYENSIINSYYAMYNNVLAFLYKCGIKSENHTGSMIILKEIINKPELAESLEDMKRIRIDSQYYTKDNQEEEKKKSQESIKESEEFILKMKILMNSIKNSEIERIRESLGGKR
ncbi:DNA-binding protein [Candidatus Pacearchaeota archaeon CG10_big_fil_rev_8_21_14_0_10_35_13]|nr:MAG: DNA-binding protein [Candidatus Pacearchaeota archaeon CG10_big_fil_rev_8_21_14_0_10_35_13]